MSPGPVADVGDHLLILRNEQAEVLSKLSSLIQSMETKILAPMKDKVDTSAPVLMEMDKNHVKSFKKMLNSYNNKKKELNRLEVKMRKGRKNTPDLQYKKEQKIREIELESQKIEEEEKKQIAEVAALELSLYRGLGRGLCDVAEQQLAIFGQSFDLSRELLKFSDALDAADEDNALHIEAELECGDGLVRITPPSSPAVRRSLLRSVSGSMLSLTSVVDQVARARRASRTEEQIVLAEVAELLQPEDERRSKVDSVEVDNTPVCINGEGEAAGAGRSYLGVGNSFAPRHGLGRRGWAGRGGGVAVTTSLAEHLQLLDSQNSALLGLLAEERRVEEALNLELATAAK